MTNGRYLMPLRDLLSAVSDIYGVWDEPARKFLADEDAMDNLARKLWEAKYEYERASHPAGEKMREISAAYADKVKTIKAAHKAKTCLP